MTALKSAAFEVVDGKRLASDGRICCDICKDQPATRLSSWSAACNVCSLSEGQQHNVNDRRLQLRIVKEHFPRRHRGLQECSACLGTKLVILYDEVDDEWLFCGGCRNFKQLLRCWNMYTNTMIDYLERPMIRQSESTLREQVDLSDESDYSRSDVDSGDDEASTESSVVEYPTEDLGDHTVKKELEIDLIFDSDLPPLEDLVVKEDEEVSIIKKSKRKKKSKIKVALQNQMKEEGRTRSKFKSVSSTYDVDPEMPDLISASDSDSDNEAANMRKTSKVKTLSGR